MNKPKSLISSPARKLRREFLKALSYAGLRSASVMVNDRKIRIPLSHGVGASNLIVSSDHLANFVSLAANREGMAIDVGANIGLFLVQLYAAGWFDKNRSYLGFEPNVLCSQYVQELCRINSIANAYCLPVALSDRFSVPILYGHREADKMASLNADYAFREHRKDDYSSLVLAHTGDNVIEAVSDEPVGIIKIDVEGHEYKVLQGLKETIIHSQPWVLCEIWPLISGDLQIDSKIKNRIGVFGFFAELGFFACYKGKKLIRLAGLSEEEILGLPGDDYLFVPGQDAETHIEFSLHCS